MRKPRPSARLLKAALISLAGCVTSGCADWKQITGTAAQVCNTWKPILPSRSDKLTEGTARQVAGNNAANEAWCGAQPIVKEPRIASTEQKDVKP